MEDVLTQLNKDAAAPKFAPVRQACQLALDTLKNAELVSQTPAHLLREKCLEALQLALETRAKRLATCAIRGIQYILKDERFQSSMESELEDHWLPMQVLNTVWVAPNLPEDTQVEIMKVLLNMTFASAYCMNAKVITKISQVYLDTYSSSAQSVRTAVKATMTQMLASFAEKMCKMEQVEDGDDVLADFRSTGIPKSSDGHLDDLISILKFLTDKLESSASALQGKACLPLLLEGVNALLSNAPDSLRDQETFKELLWKQLCPSLISLLGTPKAERSALVQKVSVQDEMGRGSGCSSSAPNIQISTAKIIYNIAVALVHLVGIVGSLRPVLESLYNRMMLYPPPQHRHDALRAIKEILSSPERLVDLTATTVGDGKEKGSPSLRIDTGLLKLIVDSIQECCHCNDSSVCVTSVTCIDLLLGSLEQLSKGAGLTQQAAEDILNYYDYLEKGEDSVSRNHTTPTFGIPAECRMLIQNCDQLDGGSQEPQTTTCIPEIDKHEPIPENGMEENSVAMDSEDQENQPITEPETSVTDDEPINTAVINEGYEQSTNQTQCDSSDQSEMRKHQEQLRKKFEQVERQSAVQLVHALTNALPGFLDMYSVQEVDDALQHFASNFCTDLTSEFTSNQSSDDDSLQYAILNADGVYIAVVATLLLNLKLINAGYYIEKDKECIPLTEAEFVEDVLGNALLLFLSPTWLQEVYRHALVTNFLGAAGVRKKQDCCLVLMLKDIDGLGSHEVGGQFLSDSRNTEDHDAPSDIGNTAILAGKHLSHTILSNCWEGVLDVLSVLLNGKSSCGISSSLALMLGIEGAKEESLRDRDAICMSLNGLQKAARLCCTLGLQVRCGSVFSQLANTSCVIEDDRRSPLPDRKLVIKTPTVIPTKPKLVRLHAAHVLSMDVVITTGLEMGSHAADCWKHVFRCCAHISELEHTYFSAGNNQSSLPKIHQEQAAQSDEGCSDLYMPAMMPVVPVAPRISITELIKQSGIESGWDSSLSGGGVLSAAQASKALCGLSQEVDRLFEDAANCLNLHALLSFLTEACCASRQQLKELSALAEDDDYLSSSLSKLPTNALHIYRIQEVLMKILHSNRPLLHLMRTWSVVSPFLVEAAGHSDRSVSKMSITCIHDYVIAVLTNHPELPHFHVNELLCKTFENLLCLELCDGDAQDQIVCCICELVEACTAEIHSGWRPLFAALRAVKIEYTANEEVNEARQHHVAAVLDVFDVYLGTNNVHVFANATVDCILCLLKYVRGPGAFEDISDDESDSGDDLPSGPTRESLCIPALNYLQQCCTILASMWQMPACPVFNGAHRIHLGSVPKTVDPVIPNMDYDLFLRDFHSSAGKPTSNEARATEETADLKTALNIEHASLTASSEPTADELTELAVNLPFTEISDSHSLDSGLGAVVASKQGNNVKNVLNSASKWHLTTLSELDNHSGILHVWSLVLEGLATAISICPKNYQPQTLEMMFEILRASAKVPGRDFSLHCVNHLLLPMLQSWLRRNRHVTGAWDMGVANFKQCCGLCTDLVVDFIHEFIDDTQNCSMLEFMLKQLLDVLTECVAEPLEAISGLGCSCLRHALLSASSVFTESMWEIVATGFNKVIHTTTYSLQRLMLPFHLHSENFYGDIGQVKVATRRDCSEMESERLRQLAQQVFLLDDQMSENISAQQPTMDDDKSYIFLLYPPGHEDSLNPDHITTRVSFRSLVVGLLSHQQMLQTIGSLLLGGDHSGGAANIEQCNDDEEEAVSSQKLPGMLSRLSTKIVLKFLQYLHSSYDIACQFDSRPGLKFLIQKVMRSAVAVNLYKQAGASMVFYINTLIQICSHISDLKLDIVKMHLADFKMHRSLNMAQIDSQKETAVTSFDINGSAAEHNCGNVSDNENKETCESDENSEQKQDSNTKDIIEDDNKNTSKQSHTNVGSHMTTPSFIKKFLSQECPNSILLCPDIFLNLVCQICDELCVAYIDILLDKEGTYCSDRMSNKPLFFLIAQPEDIADITKSLRSTKLNREQDVGIPFQTVCVQGQDEDDKAIPDADDANDNRATSPIRSKRDRRTDKESRIYTVATDNLIKNLMTEYKKRKQHHTMPTFIKLGRQKKPRAWTRRADASDAEIERQQQSSLMKDSEAHIKSWTELLCSILQLFQQLPDHQFHALLPTVFHCVNQLVCHAEDPRLKDSLGQWLYRVGRLTSIALE